MRECVTECASIPQGIFSVCDPQRRKWRWLRQSRTGGIEVINTRCPILLVRCGSLYHFSLSSCLSSFPVMIPFSPTFLLFSLTSFFFSCAIYLNYIVNTCILSSANVSYSLLTFSTCVDLCGMSLTEIYKHLLSMKMVSGQNVEILATNVMPSFFPVIVNPSLQFEDFLFVSDLMQEMFDLVTKWQRLKLKQDEVPYVET